MPGRTLALRKCEDHEDCQLQSVNDGPWEHTPAARSIGTRLAPFVTADERLERAAADAEGLRLRLSDEVAKAMGISEELAKRVYRDDSSVREITLSLADLRGEASDLVNQMSERLRLAEQRLHEVEELPGAARRAELLLHEAERLGAELAGDHGALAAQSNRMARDMERLDRLTGKLEQAAAEARAQSAAAQRDAGQASETVVRLDERIPRLDGLLSRSEELVSRLAKVDDLYTTVAEVEQASIRRAEELRDLLNELERRIEHERGERIQDTAKHQRQLREVMKHA